jgi:hypothetical protein
MQAALKLNTTVLPGHRIEITAPELPEGTNVELIVLPDLPASSSAPARSFKDVIEFLDSLTPVQRTPEEWAEVEREFQEERASWDF